MSQSSGVLLSSLGQGLVQFAGVYGDTKTSSLEAEGQRLKEMRLQEMQANRNTLTDAFRVAEYDSSQERLKIAQEASALSQEKFAYEKKQDLKPKWEKLSYDKLVPEYATGPLGETILDKDGNKQITSWTKQSITYLVDPETREAFTIAPNADGVPTLTSVGSADQLAATGADAAGTIPTISLPQFPVATVKEVQDEFQKRFGKHATEQQVVDIIENGIKTNVYDKDGKKIEEPDAKLSDTGLSDAELAFIEEEVGQSKLSRSAQTVVADTVAALWKKFQESQNYHKNDPFEFGYAPEPTVTPQEEIIPMAERSRNPGESGISVPSMASSQVAPQPLIPSPVTSAFGTNASGMEESSAQLATQEQTIPMGKRFRNPGGSAISVAGIDVSSPVTGPQQLPAGEIPSFPDRVGRSKTELVIESWMGAIPRAISRLMPIEYSQFLKSYPTLKAAREAEANQSGEDKISFTSAWKTVAKWVESQNLDIAPGGGAITEEVLDSAAEASDPATIRGEFGIPPDVNPMPDRTRNPGDTGISVPSTLPPARTFDPSDGMGMNSSLANAGSFPATGGIISAPPTEEQQKNLDILESLRKQGSFGNKVEPEPVNLAPVGQTVSQASTSPDTSSNKDAKTQVLEIVAAMEQANIGKEVIRKELLRLLELIKPAEAESPYARALAEVYFEFTKESN